MRTKNYTTSLLKLNMPPDTNKIGQSGEEYVHFIFSMFNFFNLYFLGDKAPVEDFFGELADNERPYNFLIQVKSTKLGCNKNKHLNISFNPNKRDELIKRPLPTYLLGVDLKKLDIYICPIFDSAQSFSTIPPSFVVNINNWNDLEDKLDKLRVDIIRYWEKININNHKTTYKSSI